MNDSTETTRRDGALPSITMPIALLASLAWGCARPSNVTAAAAAPGGTSADTRRAVDPSSNGRGPAPVKIAFQVTRPGAPRGLEGRTHVGLAPLRVTSVDDERHERTSLEIRAHRHRDGMIEVTADYEERGDHKHISWTPSLAMRPKDSAKVTLDGGDWSRELTVTAE